MFIGFPAVSEKLASCIVMLLAAREATVNVIEASLPLPIFDVLGKGDEGTGETAEVARLNEQIATRTSAIAKDRAIMAKRRRKESGLRWRVLCARDGLLRGTMRFANG